MVLLRAGALQAAPLGKGCASRPLADPCWAGRPWMGPAAAPGGCVGWCQFRVGDCERPRESGAATRSRMQQVFELISPGQSIDAEVASIKCGNAA